MQLQELLDAAQLRLRVLYAEEDDLARDFTWAYTTDLPDPRRYLTRGQLVLSGLVFRTSAADTEAFVERIVEAGAVALLAGEGLLGHVPDDVVAACRRHGLPLLAAPRDVSFAAVTAFISNTLAGSRVQSLAAGLVRQRELLLDVYRGQMLSELVERVSADLGRPLWVVSATGRPIAASTVPLGDLATGRVVAAYLAADHSPVVIREAEDGDLTAFVVTTVGDHRATAWLLVTAGGWTDWHPAILDVVRELASVVGLYRVQHVAHVAEKAHSATRLVELVSADNDQPELAVYLRQAGIHDGTDAIVVVAAFDGRPDLQRLAIDAVADVVGHVAAPVVGRDGDDRVVAFIPLDREATSAGAPTELPPAVALALDRLASGFDDGAALRVGVSLPVAADGLGGALRSARYALHRAANKGGSALAIAHASGALSAMDVIATVSDELRRAFVETVLGVVRDHDERHHGQLMETLRTFLECDGSWTRTAEAMHLHVNSVRYRVARVEELTGRDLGSTADRADMFLALHLL